LQDRGIPYEKMIGAVVINDLIEVFKEYMKKRKRNAERAERKLEKQESFKGLYQSNEFAAAFCCD